MTARHWAAFGELIRRSGDWNGKQVLDANVLRECFKGSQPNPAYGLTWWLKRPVTDDPRRPPPVMPEEWADVANCASLPADLTSALGAGGQRLYILPSLKLVAVRLADQPGEGFSDLEFLALLLGQ
jgi:CubicO group peptidase (beta-lactamase class C family)